jgi:hypothetical protein
LGKKSGFGNYSAAAVEKKLTAIQRFGGRLHLWVTPTGRYLYDNKHAMKKLLLLLLTAPLFAAAQDSTAPCKLRTERDPYTKEVRFSTGALRIGNYQITGEASAKEIDLFINLAGTAACFNDQSAVQVTYSGTRLKNSYKNGGTMNCEGYFHMIFRNTPETQYSLRKLVDQRIATMTFGTDKNATVITLTEEQKDIVQAALRCLVTDAKTLIPAQ